MNSLFKFDPEKIEGFKTPKDIISEQCKELFKLTAGLIIAKITSYDGEIESYYQPSLYNNITLNISASISSGKSFDVQSTLGETTENLFTYEFYITSKATANYKYRVLFIRYGIACYPATLVIDETIAKQLDINTRLECKDEDEFTTLLQGVLNSDKIKEVINNLYNINI